ncbi:hypothetical protein MQC88_08295 [Luteimonas sp. 50]|uniref:Uncharacterized protein n=1 Tax=Cognatiluteimonas sedimenti TaxID=2927791 RepID=A0ABT0A4Q4_9GAMM|nr:hypothetical protein [Lysobacter sedimenti]MCJ0825954.1 hypothetical protein [Lysobacter sedimenti]
MQTPVDARIADDNRLQRAVQRAMAPAQRPPLPGRALIGERLADHGTDSGREARTKMADELHQLVAQVEALRRNPTLNAAQIELAVADDVQARVDRLLAECEEQGQVIQTMERAVEQGIDAALSPPRPEWYGLATEYRAALLDMTDEQREAFIERLQGTRDMPLLRYAIGSVPPELSGVSFGVHRNMEGTLLALKDPTLLSRPADLKKRRAALAVAVDGIRRTAAELVDSEAAAVLRSLAEGNPT